MKKLLLFIILFIPLTVLGYNEVINPLCTNKEKLALRNDVLNFSYAIEKYKDKDNIYYKVTILNMNQNSVINYNKEVYTVNNNVISNINPGSTILMETKATPGGICDGYNITTKVLNIPYYNKYKDNELCKGNEEYFLCKENTNTTINEEEFKRQIESYIKKKDIIVDEEEEPSIIKEENIYKKIIEFVEENYIYILFGTIVLGTIGIAFLLIRQHNKNELL